MFGWSFEESSVGWWWRGGVLQKDWTVHPTHALLYYNPLVHGWQWTLLRSPRAHGVILDDGNGSDTAREVIATLLAERGT